MKYSALRHLRSVPVAALLAFLAPAASAQVHQPGSALVFPLHRSGATFTLVSVTNSHPSKSTNAVFHYVNAAPTPGDALHPSSCEAVYRFESLTPSDTVTRVTACHNGAAQVEGFLMVLAKDPNTGCATDHDRLIGSELVIGPLGSVFSLTPYAFQGLSGDATCTDDDFDGRPDFDGVEYSAAPDELLLDSFIPLANPRLTLLHLGADLNQDVTVHMDVFNDNEYPLSYTFNFRCWFDLPLAELSGVFTENFLAGTPDSPGECDSNCDGNSDFETGWARIDAIVASSPWQTTVNPAILGAVVGGPGSFEGGRLLWGSGTTAGEL